MSPCPPQISTGRCYYTVCCYKIVKVDICCKWICSFVVTATVCKNKRKQKGKQKGGETKQIHNLCLETFCGRLIALLAAMKDLVQHINTWVPHF